MALFYVCDCHLGCGGDFARRRPVILVVKGCLTFKGHGFSGGHGPLTAIGIVFFYNFLGRDHNAVFHFLDNCTAADRNRTTSGRRFLYLLSGTFGISIYCSGIGISIGVIIYGCLFGAVIFVVGYESLSHGLER